MHISDKKILMQEYFAREYRIKDKVELNRKHDEERMRVFDEKDQLIESRKLAAKEHEEIKNQNMIAMDKEVDKKMDFIKKSLGLNVI